METVVRPYQPADAAAIVGIYNHYVEHTTVSFEAVPLSVSDMERRLEGFSSKWPCFVAERDGEIIGYCYAHAWKERAAYRRTLETTVYLAPSARGGGVGRKLMERLIGQCRAEGFHVLIACITRENVESCRFHESLGFRKVSQFGEVGFKFGRYLDVEDYELRL